MKEKLIGCLILLMVLAAFLIGNDRVLTLKDQTNPFFLKADKNRLYLADGPSISIYSMPELILIKKIGRKGEGPGEFVVSPTQNMGSVLFDVYPGYILVHSIGKSTYFSKNGEFIKEFRSKIYGLKPIGDSYVGFGFKNSKEGSLNTINLLDKNQNVIKTLHEEKGLSFTGSQINPFAFRSSLFFIHQKSIIVERDKNWIEILDCNGNLESKINPQIKEVNITTTMIKDYQEAMKKVPLLKGFYNTLYQRLKFPKKFPKVCMFEVNEDKIFIITYSDTEQGREVQVFDLSGGFLGKHYIKDFKSILFLPYPFSFGNGNFYQVDENEENGEPELLIQQLK